MFVILRCINRIVLFSPFQVRTLASREIMRDDIKPSLVLSQTNLFFYTCIYLNQRSTSHTFLCWFPISEMWASRHIRGKGGSLRSFFLSAVYAKNVNVMHKSPYRCVHNSYAAICLLCPNACGLQEWQAGWVHLFFSSLAHMQSRRRYRAILTHANFLEPAAAFATIRSTRVDFVRVW